MRFACLTLALLSVLLIDLRGQAPNWAVTPGVSGSPTWTRENPGAASATHMYVFGGKTGNAGGVVTNALWEFDGATWTQRTANGAVGSPPARDKAAVCWDSSRNVLVVFGGEGTSGVLGDTWEWDPMTNAWTQIMITGPSARRWVAMAADPSAAGDVVLFGGLDGSGTHLNDTWVYVGGASPLWYQAAPTNIPAVRRQHSMVTRPDLNDVVLCCGQDATQVAPAKWRTDVWTWDGFDWTLIPTTNTPAAVVANQAVYDVSRQQIVVTGGNGINGGSPTSEISEFDSVLNDWVVYAQATPSTPAPVIGRVSRYFAAYLPSTGYIYKINGQQQSGASVSTTLQYGFGLPPIYPGNGADVAIEIVLNGSVSAGSAGVHSVAPSDLVGFNFLSPGGTLNNQGFAVAASLFTTGSPPAGIPTASIWIDLASFFFIIDGLTPTASPFLPALAPGGFGYGPFSVPVGLSGSSTSIIMQAVTVAGGVGLSDGVELAFQ